MKWHMCVAGAALSLCACSWYHYERVDKGELKGRLVVEWIEADRFVFRPDKDNPLAFTRRNGDKIAPGLMYTDGGSIPRPFWAIKNYSPWGYAPAFIVHDWLFHMKGCKSPGYERYSFEESARILSEVMKTMMESYGEDAIDKGTLLAIYEGVRSPVARRVWDGKDCPVPPPEVLAAVKPKIVYVLEFK